MPGTVLGAGDMAANETKMPAFLELVILSRVGKRFQKSQKGAILSFMGLMA
jgi:hypothetical protein